MKRHTKLLLATLVVAVAGVLFLAYQRHTQEYVYYLEDRGNRCFWGNDGQISGGTLVYTPPESMKTVKVPKANIATYLAKAKAENTCTTRK